MMKRVAVAAITGFILFTSHGPAIAGGPFGPPQPVSKEEGGLYTGIGYGYHEDIYQNGGEHVFRQNQVYSHLAYGAKNWEIFGRIGISDLKISDAFSSTRASTTTSKNDFEDNWKLFGTLGGKGYYPFTQALGMGAFMQGSYYFKEFRDRVFGTQDGVPFTSDLEVGHFWDVNFGLGLQATVPYGIRLYIGPYVYYSEAKISLFPAIPGLYSDRQSMTVHNRTNVGGFTGIDVPLARGFRLNLEGQYSERFSFGAAVTFSY
jgi:hypothetical protein